MVQFNVNLIRGNVDLTKPMAARTLSGIDKYGRNLTIKGGKYLTPLSYNAIENIDAGLQILIHTPIKNFIAHIMPNLENIETVGQKVAEIAAKLRDESANKTKEVFAFITGGKSSESTDPLAADSSKMLNNVYDALEEEGVETTVIASPYTEREKYLTTCTRKDKIDCTGGLIDTLPEIPNNATNKEVQDILENYYEFVEISPNTKVNIFKRN